MYLTIICQAEKGCPSLPYKWRCPPWGGGLAALREPLRGESRRHQLPPVGLWLRPPGVRRPQCPREALPHPPGLGLYGLRRWHENAEVGHC